MHAAVGVQCVLWLWRRKRRRCLECIREKRRERGEGKRGGEEERDLLRDDHNNSGRGNPRVASQV